MILKPLPDTDGGGDLSLARLGTDSKPECVVHGAMNKLDVGPAAIWRCITTTGTNGKRCNAGTLGVAVA